MGWTADSTQITADQTCWTADGFNGCDVVTGGGKVRKRAYRREVEVDRAFATYDQQQLVITDISKILGGEEELPIPKIDEVIPPEQVAPVIAQVIKQYDPAPSMLALDISHTEATWRAEEYIRAYIEQRNQNALALILIMANL